LAAALVTWQKLSQTQRLPVELVLTDDLAQNPRDAESVLKRISSHLHIDVFNVVAQRLNQLSHRAASQILSMVLLQGKNGLLDAYDPSDLMTVLIGGRGGINTLPTEVCDLLLMLAGKEMESGSVYLPWGGAGQVFGRFLREGLPANAEFPYVEEKHLVELIRAYYEKTPISRIQVSDPIKSPSYIEAGDLTKFDLVIATPPFGVRVDFELQVNDPFRRFPEKSNSMTVLGIRHVMAQTKGRAIIVVTNGVLSSAGGEKRLRKDLLEAGQIEAVIGLPAGLLLPRTAIATSILVLNNEQRHDHVRFINCDLDKFKVTESKTRFKLTELEYIAALAMGQAQGPELCVVHRKELFDNDMNLSPARYVVDSVKSQVDQFLEGCQTRSIEDIASILRPALSVNIEEPIPALEVGAQDMSSNGYIESPQKGVVVEGRQRRNDDQFLKPMDIVMVTKGSVGKISIAPLDTPPPGPGGWVIGQTMVVIRTNSDFDPRGLVVFLRSDYGQELLRRLVAGSAVPFLQTRELRQLKVPVLTLEQTEQAVAVLERQQQVCQEIQRLQKELKTIQVDAWQLPPDKQAVK
jgi:type I restriction enzyme M protein